MKPKIAILGYKDFIDLTKGIIKNINNNVTIDVYQCLLEECLEVLPILTEEQTDIIITGRANQQLLKQITDIPIITFKITAIDILSAIKKALKHSNHIAIAMAKFEEIEYDYSILVDLLDLNFEFITYNTQDELETKIKGFASSNGTVIGTTVAVNYAKKYNLNNILIYSLENTILEAINRAIEIIDFNRKEEKKAKEFEAIFHSVSDGILATNEENEITLINHSASKLLSLEGNKIGKKVESIFTKTDHQNIVSKKILNDELIEYNNTTFNVNRVPIMVKESKAGNVTIFQDITEIQKLEQKYRYETEAKGLIAKTSFNQIIYQTPIMKKNIEKAKRYAQTDSTILIIGETGTGKELFAQSIHNYSNRNNSPFVAINCGALPENLLESELFGYEDGAFTGANKKGKKGLFEIAHNGTIFLDEINSVSLHFQSRLLRVLQEREVVKIGGSKVIPVNIRVIAAANEDLSSLVKENKFRKDLYYRLNVLKIHIPPLRNRIDDVLPLAKQFILDNNKSLYYSTEPFFKSLCDILSGYHYPGNIRELYNILERFIILYPSNEEIAKESCLQLLKECMEIDNESNIRSKIQIPIMESYKDSVFEADKVILSTFLEMFNGNKGRLAKNLGIGRTTLYRKLKELNIE
ncbi:sigma 54-interacting transcriptional regulator [Mesobacillus maritimus]|uniref:sigma 54-interacting transcriptional regulator n=1 Tax=Mesobacillus maritimus TaxID=1643336 RepID=UPI003850315A